MNTAVMASRREAPDSLDFFPTPPWATRALIEHVIPDAKGTAWEPAAGESHMAYVLRDRFERVIATDVHDYGGLDAIGSFVGAGLDVIPSPTGGVDWIITNPPFNLAEQFAERALCETRVGVAFLLRSTWVEGRERYEGIFSRRPMTAVAQFVERVPMVKGRWDPRASSATAYSWFVWQHAETGPTRLIWIPPGCRNRLTKPDDVRRFGSIGTETSQPSLLGAE